MSTTKIKEKKLFSRRCSKTIELIALGSSGVV
jgi:hypothetical protein